MLNKMRLALFLSTLLLGACTVTGPADDGYENSNEWGNNGRLFSNDSKALYKSEQRQASSMALNDKTEFEQFKIWNRLRTEGVESEEYVEFLQWLSYQEFKAQR